MCRFKIDKTFTQSRSLEQRMVVAKISLHCIPKCNFNKFFKCLYLLAVTVDNIIKKDKC